MLKHTTVLLVTALLALVAGCSKDLPSGPGAPPGEPVILNGTPKQGISRNISLVGTIENRSGRMIYDVRVAMKVYRDDPFFETVTDTSNIVIDSLAHGDTGSFTNIEVFGDRFIDAFAVWSYLPP